MTNQYLPPNPTALRRIKHIVVLMLENRSFDNLLGWLYEKRKPPRGQAFEGLHKGLWNPLNNIDTDGLPFIEQVHVRKNGEVPKGKNKGKGVSNTPDFTLPDPDPGEGFRDTNHQLFQYYSVSHEFPPEPTNMGFVNNYANAMLYGTYAFGDAPCDPRLIMTCYTPEQVPVLSELARQFAVCDQWFASVPSQTLPNRDFIHAATSNGQVNNKPNALCNARTIFNQIEDAIQHENRSDLSWRVYSGTQKGKPFSLTRLIMTELHDAAFDKNFLGIERFYTDAANGSLPSYTFLEPQFSGPDQNDQHPPSDIRSGDQLIADVYHALIASPQWPETLLVITYDEHGGCYDHVAPPKHATPPDGVGAPGQDGFTFNRFGVRVPTVLVSPWIEAGTVARPAGYTPFDHTSVIATVQSCLGLTRHLTARDAAAPDLSCVLTLSQPRTDQPKVKPLRRRTKPDSEHVNNLHKIFEAVLTKLTGQPRPSEQELLAYVAESYETMFGKR